MIRPSADSVQALLFVISVLVVAGSVSFALIADGDPEPTPSPSPRLAWSLTPLPTDAPTPSPSPSPSPVPTISLVDVDWRDEVCFIEAWNCEAAIVVALCESGGDPSAYNDTAVYDVNGVEHHAYGRFQLLIPMHAHRFPTGSYFDPVENALAAWSLYSERGWYPAWAGCTP